MATLFCVRHGETDWNREGRWQGHRDRGLTERGHGQAALAARALRAWPFAAVYSSDLARARDSAAPLAAERGVVPVELAGLREIDTGSWTGLTRAEVAERDPAGAARHRAGATGWAGGETYEQLQRRVGPALEEVAGRHAPADRVAIFTHGGVIRAAVAHAFGASATVARTVVAPLTHLSLTVLQVTADEPWRLLVFNHPLAPADPAAELA